MMRRRWPFSIGRTILFCIGLLVVVLVVASTPALLHALAVPFYTHKGDDADRLFDAIRRDSAALRGVLADAADPNAYRVDCYGVLFSLALVHGPPGLTCQARTPLRVALESDKFDAASILLDHGATLAPAARQRVSFPDPHLLLARVATAQQWPLFQRLLAQVPEPSNRICMRLLGRLLVERLDRSSRPTGDIAALQPLAACARPVALPALYDLIYGYKPEEVARHDDLLQVLAWLAPLPPGVVAWLNQRARDYSGTAWLEPHFSFLRRLRPSIADFGQSELLSSALQFPDLGVADWLLAEGADPNGFDAIEANIYGTHTTIAHTTLAKLVTAQCREPDPACLTAIDWLLPRVARNALPSGHYSPMSELLILFIRDTQPALAAAKQTVLERLIDNQLFDPDSPHLRALIEDPRMPKHIADRMRSELSTVP